MTRYDRPSKSCHLRTQTAPRSARRAASSARAVAVLRSGSPCHQDDGVLHLADLDEIDVLVFNYRGYGDVFTRLLRQVRPVIVGARVP